MAPSVRVILSARAAWAVANDADVEENVRTASMMARKSRVEIVIYYGGGVDVLGPTASIGVVLRVEGSRGAEDAEVVSKGAGIKDARTRCSSLCTTGGGCSLAGRSATGWSSSGSGGGRRKERGIICHRSTVRMASRSRWHSSLGSSGNPMCSNTWKRSLGNRRGVDLALDRCLQ